MNAQPAGAHGRPTGGRTAGGYLGQAGGRHGKWPRAPVGRGCPLVPGRWCKPATGHDDRRIGGHEWRRSPMHRGVGGRATGVVDGWQYPWGTRNRQLHRCMGGWPQSLLAAPDAHSGPRRWTV